MIPLVILRIVPISDRTRPVLFVCIRFHSPIEELQNCASLLLEFYFVIETYSLNKVRNEHLSHFSWGFSMEYTFSQCVEDSHHGFQNHQKKPVTETPTFKNRKTFSEKRPCGPLGCFRRSSGCPGQRIVLYDRIRSL